jgi:NhaP-type Na+/H+ or K+/H+ antiporter
MLVLGLQISLPLALVLGTVSATDPVSVVALFRSLGVPKRLSVLMEGEAFLMTALPSYFSALCSQYS